MFKKYRLEWTGRDGQAKSTDFFVHSKATRGGFMHRACALGPLPRLDDMDTDWGEYKANDEKLLKKRMAKVSYINRSWECYSGQTCLDKLWNQLANLMFVDMGRISISNPFNSEDEPDHEDLWEPEELFEPFTRK